MITPSALIDKFRYMLANHWGYILNTAGQLWTAQDQKHTTNEMAIAYGSQWIGHYVTDCSGAFTWSFSQLGGYMYHGSNTMYRKYTTANGQINSQKDLQPGYAVFKRKKDKSGKWADGWDYYHVGLYVGNGRVIEAKSTPKGVVESSVSEWSHYGKLKGVSYKSDDHPDDKDKNEGQNDMNVDAVIVAENGKDVNVRQAKSKTSTKITQLPVGTKVRLIEESDGWSKIEFLMQGYVMSKFVQPEVKDDA